MNRGAVAVTYDGTGQRVAETVAGSSTRYLVDDLSPTGYPQVVEELQGGAVVRQYTYGLNLISQQQAVNHQWTPSFYGLDGLGSVRTLTSLAGAVTDTYTYDAFGNVLSQTGTTPNTRLYRARVSPRTLLQPDEWALPIPRSHPGKTEDPASRHRYLNTGHNPVRHNDPAGSSASEVAIADSSLEEEAPKAGVVERRVSCILQSAGDTLVAMLVTDPRDTHAQAEQLIGVAVQLAECTAEGDRKPTECPLCFAPGTPVHERGGIVPIEEVKEGDEVLAYDPKTGKNEYRPVTALTPAHLAAP